ncbi:MAG TPA: DUF2815 family protein, partial [Clostridia bacterium]|nr:DUF2815 family protein [Clostridia bacterium]
MSNKPTQVTTNEVRISYEHLLKPYANQPGAEEKFSVTLLIPKADLATKQRIDASIQAAAQEGMATKWGGVRPAQLAIPIYDGDGVRPSGEAFGPECKGHWVMTASSKQRPEIVDANLSPIIDATQIYSGMYARISINFFPYLSNGKKGVGCGLGPVQKTRDGEPLGGRVSAAEAFGGAAPAQQAPAYQQPYQAPQPQYTPPQYAQPQYAPTAGYAGAAAPWMAPSQQPQPYAAVDPITGKPI